MCGPQAGAADLGLVMPVLWRQVPRCAAMLSNLNAGRGPKTALVPSSQPLCPSALLPRLVKVLIGSGSLWRVQDSVLSGDATDPTWRIKGRAGFLSVVPTPTLKPPQHLVNHLESALPQTYCVSNQYRGPGNRCRAVQTNSVPQEPPWCRPQGPLSGYVAWRTGGHSHCLLSDCLGRVQTGPLDGSADAPQPMARLTSFRLLSLHLLPSASNVQPWSLWWGGGPCPLRTCCFHCLWLQFPAVCLCKARSET